MSLESRLASVFGSLGGSQDQGAGSWALSQSQQVFRSGVDAGSSEEDDEEYAERARREVVPGLAMDLAAEDAMDETGLLPSAAFCGALDREEEWDQTDELAAGEERELLRSLARGGARPAHTTEVWEDPVWEARVRQQECHLAGAAGLAQQQLADTDMEQPAAEAPGSGGSGSQRSALTRTTTRSALAGTSAKSKDRLRVRFSGLPQPYVPPHQRDTFVASDVSDAPAEEAQRRAWPGSKRLGTELPLHVRHPENYRMYVLDNPITVGGGLAQLGPEGRLQAPMEAAEGGPEDAGAAEAPRWQGEVGAGIQFRPRAAPAAVGAVAQQRPREEGAEVGISFADADAAGQEEEEMRDAPAPAAASGRQRAGRSYRSKPAEREDD